MFAEFKLLCDKKKEVYDGDLLALIEQHSRSLPHDEWTLVAWNVNSGSGHKPNVRLTLRRGDREVTEELSDGDGPIDCAFLATEKITRPVITRVLTAG